MYIRGDGGQSSYLDDVQVEEHSDRGTNFMLETMHLEPHALEYDLGAGSEGYLLEDSGDLRRIEAIGWHENVKLRR